MEPSTSSGSKSSKDLLTPVEEECARNNDDYADDTDYVSATAELNERYEKWKIRGRPRMSKNHIWNDYEIKTINRLLDQYAIFNPFRDVCMMYVVKWLCIIFDMQVSEIAVWEFAKTKYPKIYNTQKPAIIKLEASPVLYRLPPRKYPNSNPKLLKFITKQFGLS